MFAYDWFCFGWAFLWQACTRLSIFLVAVLSISRTVSLYYPFRKISFNSIYIPVALYTMLVLGQQLLPVFAGKSFWYARRLSLCTWLLTDVVELIAPDGSVTTMFKVLHFFFVTLENVLPAFPIVTSCIISIIILKKSKARQNPHHQQQKDIKCFASTTIIYLTIAYILFNVPFISMLIMESIMVMSNFKFHISSLKIPETTLNFIYTLIGVHMVALNSTTNVIIYFSRKKGLRKFWRSVLFCKINDLNANDISKSDRCSRRTKGKFPYNSPSEVNKDTKWCRSSNSYLECPFNAPKTVAINNLEKRERE